MQPPCLPYPLSQVGTAPRASALRLKERWESRSRGLGQPQICWLTVIHMWDCDLSFCSTPFLLLMKRSREEKATSCLLFGAVGGILKVQFTELLLRRLSRIACAADIGTFCSGYSAKPTPDKLHMLKCFSEGYFSHVCVFFSCCSAFKSVCDWSLRSAVPPLLVSVSWNRRELMYAQLPAKEYILLHFLQRSRIKIYANNYLNFYRNLPRLLFHRLFC